MENFEELVEAISDTIMNKERDISIDQIFDEMVNPNDIEDLEKLKKTLRNAIDAEPYHGNEVGFKSWIRGLLSQHIKKYQ